MGIGSNGPGTVVLGTADRAAAVAAVKAQARIALADDDALIAAFAETALGIAEQFAGRVCIARTMTEKLAVTGGWQRLGATPVSAIAGVSAGGVALAVGSYAVDVDADGQGWVRVGASGIARVEVSFSAGTAPDWAGLPTPIRQGAVLLAAHLYADRDAERPPPAAVTALWRPFRMLALTGAAR